MRMTELLMDTAGRIARFVLTICLVLSLGASVASANLITNGDFETGDFTGWTSTGNTGFTGVTGAFSSVAPHGGNEQAYFGAVGSLGYITQPGVTTIGDGYELSYWLYNFGGTPSVAQVKVNGSIVPALHLVNPGQFEYTQYTYSFQATSGSTAIEFGFQQDPSYFLLDDVSLVRTSSPVPEPCTLAIWSLLGVCGMGIGWRRRKQTA